MNRVIQLNRTTPLFGVAIMLACFALLPVARAVVPAPDGCYPSYTTAEGCNALNFLTSGAGNTALGWYSLFSNTDASFNTGVGGGALALNNGDSNTAVGVAALLLNTAGTLNTAVGTDALVFNDSGDINTAIGAFALFNNTTGDGNTGIGTDALKANTIANANTAIGDAALFSNTTGENNTATGAAALFFNTGSNNTAMGRVALFSNIDSENNTAVGHQALKNHETGDFNNAFGTSALLNHTSGPANNAFGSSALLNLSTGNANTALGSGAGAFLVTGNGNVYIGSGVYGMASEDSHTYIRNIKDTTVSGGDADIVTIDLNTGLLGHASSSRRYKENIKPMENASETLYRLKPVIYRYKKEIDPSQSLDYGLVAEEVAEVDPNLANRKQDGQIEGVRYNAINAMLLNEFLKQHKTVKEQGAIIAHLQKQIEALTSGLQKVNTQLEMRKSAPQTALSSQ